MESKSSLRDRFNKVLLRKLETHSAPSWLANLKLLKAELGQIVFGGIPHKAYWFDIKRNHFSMIVDVLEEVCPQFGPFSRKNVLFHGGLDTKEDQQSTKVQKTSGSAELKSDDNKSESHPLKEVPQQKNQQRSSFSGVSKRTDEKNLIGMNQELDFEFKLESFVAGERNQLAARACHAVTEMPGHAFNPFLIHGVPGSGKTHLLQGIGRELKFRHPDLNVVYLTAEQFLNEFIQSIRGQKMEDFRDTYRNADLLLLDDLDLLSSGIKVQNELLHTLNHLKQQKKQIVITSRNAPSNISKLTEVLCNRLESGLVIDVGFPDSKARIEILVSKAQEKGIPLTYDLAEFMANHISGSVGRLEGALTRLGVHATLLNEPLSIELARLNLKDLLIKHAESMEHQQPLRGSQDQLKERIFIRVCSHFQVTEQDICSKRRDQRVLKARQATIYLFRELTLMSLSEMGRMFGRTHSTIHSSLMKVYERMKSDEFFRRQLHQLRDELKEMEVSPSEQRFHLNQQI